MARRRRPQGPAPDPERPGPPAWLWRFRVAEWRESGDGPMMLGGVDGAPAEMSINAYSAARRRWRAACGRWLAENDMILWGHRPEGLSWQRYREVAEREPWRIARRPA